MTWIEPVRLPFSGKCDIDVEHHGDYQIGGGSTDERLIASRIREVVQKRNSGIFLHGDIEDDDRPSTRVIKKGTFAGRREVLGKMAMDHLKWLDKKIIPMLLPLTKTKYGILGVLAGHHWFELDPVDDRERDRAEAALEEAPKPKIHSVRYICNMLSKLSGRHVPYLGQMSAFIPVTFVPEGSKTTIRKTYHLQHGTGSGSSLSEALNKLERTAQGHYADVYVRGHSNKLVAGKYDVLVPRDTEVPSLGHRTVTLMNIGSATRGYTISKDHIEYPEHGMMRPTTLGWGISRWRMRRSSRRDDPNGNWTTEVRIEL